MNPGSPSPVLFSMALPANPVRLLNGHSFPACEMEEVAVVRVVTIETPPVFLVMLQHDVGVIVDLAPGAVCLEIRVTERTREDAFGEWRRRYVDMFARTWYSNRFLHRARRLRRDVGGLRRTRLHQEGRRGYERQQDQRLHGILATIGALRSTARCISRSHIVWNTCSRCPITSATFWVTM